MKKILLVLFLALNIVAVSQELPTEVANGFGFPIGSKFTIKMYPLDSGKFDYSIIASDTFYQIVEDYEKDSLFAKEGQEGTIEFYFCYATHGKTESEKEENMKIELIMKNRTGYHMRYKSDIMREENGEFEETSNVGTYPGVITTEMWPYMIYAIGIHHFEVYENSVWNKPTE